MLLSKLSLKSQVTTSSPSTTLMAVRKLRGQFLFLIPANPPIKNWNHRQSLCKTERYTKLFDFFKWHISIFLLSFPQWKYFFFRQGMCWEVSHLGLPQGPWCWGQWTVNSGMYITEFTGKKSRVAIKDRLPETNILLMDKILHHQGWWLSHYL